MSARDHVLATARALASTKGETLSLEALREATALGAEELDGALLELVASGDLVAGRGGDDTFIRVTPAGVSGHLRALIDKVATETWVSRGRPVAARLEAWIDAQRIAHALGG